MKKNKLLIISLFALLSVCSCSNNNNNTSGTSSLEEISIYSSLGTSGSLESTPLPEKTLDEEKVNQIISGEFEVLLQSIKTEDEVVLHTEKQKSYLHGDYNEVLKYAHGDGEYSRPLPVTFSWECNASEDNVINYYTLNVSENSDMSSPWTFISETTSYDVYNLKIGTTYYWNVETYIGDLHFTSETNSFKTEDESIRNIFIEGVANCRDIGGWKIGTNQRVKQGLIYRTGRLNKNYMNLVSRQITIEGRKMMVNYLGIQTEIDLRRTDNNEVGSLTSSPLDTSVNYYQCPMVYESNKNTLVNNSPMIREIFKLLSDESNYPLFYHCSIGTDRTGLLTYLINGLLGVSEDDLNRDYLFSNFGSIGGSRELSDIEEDYIPTIKEQEGNSLSQKIENYLLKIGVTSEEISSIKTLMIETI